MKVFLVGYPKSQKIVLASRYLTGKYLKGDFQTIFLNYEGEIHGWTKYLAECLEQTNDRWVILALDDYLLSEELKTKEFLQAIKKAEDAIGIKLCHCSPEENLEYPITTQYTLWNKDYLISLLDKTTTPWDFEIKGSELHKLWGKKMLFEPILNYPTNSCLSPSWKGIKVIGNKPEDIEFLIQKGFLDEKELIR